VAELEILRAAKSVFEERVHEDGRKMDELRKQVVFYKKKRQYD